MGNPYLSPMLVRSIVDTLVALNFRRVTFGSFYIFVSPVFRWVSFSIIERATFVVVCYEVRVCILIWVSNFEGQFYLLIGLFHGIDLCIADTCNMRVRLLFESLQIQV